MYRNKHARILIWIMTLLKLIFSQPLISPSIPLFSCEVSLIYDLTVSAGLMLKGVCINVISFFLFVLTGDTLTYTEQTLH